VFLKLELLPRRNVGSIGLLFSQPVIVLFRQRCVPGRASPG
jgi:hypothetical protein